MCSLRIAGGGFEVNRSLPGWLLTLASVLALTSGSCAPMISSQTDFANGASDPSTPATNQGLFQSSPTIDYQGDTSTNCVEATLSVLCATFEGSVDGKTTVSLKMKSTDERIQIVWPFLEADYQLPGDPNAFLIGSDGSQYPLAKDEILPGEHVPVSAGQEWTVQELRFDEPRTGTVASTVHIPFVVASSSQTDLSVMIDLGADPGPGTVYALDQSVEFAGETVRFTSAEIDDMDYLHLYSEATSGDQAILVRWIFAGMPEGWTSGIGPGDKYDFERRIHDLWFPIVSTDGPLIQGTVHIPIYSAELLILGPFEIPLG